MTSNSSLIEAPAVANATVSEIQTAIDSVQNLEPVATVVTEPAEAAPKKKSQPKNKRPAKNKISTDAPAIEVIAPTIEGNVSQPMSEQAPVATHEEEKRSAKPRKPKAPPKPVDLATVGLKLIETKTEKINTVNISATAAPKGPKKVAPWQKRTAQDNKTEPLVMVETQKKNE